MARYRLLYLITSACWLLMTSAGASAQDRIEPFRADQRLVATYYFNWYIDGKTFKYYNFMVYPDPIKNPVQWAWEPYYPKGKESGSAIFGLNDPSLWPGKRLPDVGKWPDSDDWLYHVAELRAMKWAGLDFVFLDLWWPHDFIPYVGGKAPPGAKPDSLCPEWKALFRAWKYLDSRGEKPVKLSIILETPSFHASDIRAEGGKPEQLFEPIWAFYRQFLGDEGYQAVMPLHALAAIRDAEGRPRPIIDMFYPRGEGIPNGDWISRWDAGTFADLRKRFEEKTHMPPYICVTQHLHGPKYGGWDGIQSDGSIVDISRRSGVVDQELSWHSTLAGPRIREDAVSIGMGYFKPHTGDKLPGGDAKLPDGSIAYPRAYRYLKEDDKVSTYETEWREVLADPANFKKHLLVVECWNELTEATQVTPSKPKTWRDAEGKYIDRWGDSPTMYLDLTRRFVSEWKGQRKP